MSNRSIPPEVKVRFLNLINDGVALKKAAALCGVSYSTGKRWLRSHRGPDNRSSQRNEPPGILDHPVPLKRLKPEVLECVERTVDGFVAWRLRYTGRITLPWQHDAAAEIIEAYFSAEREYLVVNVAPGLGKTTLLSDLGAWFTCLDRTIRGLNGSRTSVLAIRNTNRIRHLLARNSPVRATDEAKRLGLAVDATGVPAVDFGRFKPQHVEGDVWRRDEFMVVQEDGAPAVEKEPTWSSFGFDQEYLGNRFDLSFWDDIDSNRSIRNPEIVENNRRIFDDETEPRLEPGGLLVVCQQRLGLFDFSNYCLSKKLVPDEDASATDLAPSKYRHVVYKAHYLNLCSGDHADVKPWPDGCLLDPHRMSWAELRGHMTKPNYACVYQQEDVDPKDVLVNPLWIRGGQDPDTGTHYPGCWDNNRGLAELPRGPEGQITLAGDLWSVAIADPSPTRFWAVMWVVYQPETEQRFLMDLVRQKMEAPDLLDWNYDEQRFTGIMEEWRARSVDLGVKITDWIVEENAAQRFLLQYDHVDRWQRLHQVNIHGHETHRNKSDPDRGVWSVQPHFRFGRWRLPGKQSDDSRIASLKLVDEATRYPQTATDDCVMATWMFEWNLPTLYVPQSAIDAEPDPRPSWVLEEARERAAYAAL